MKRAKYYCILLVFMLKLCNSSATCPKIVTRKDWDGLRLVHVSYLPRPVELVIIQETFTPSCKTDAECTEMVRIIQSYQMERLKFWDIGPSFLIGGNGKVYEGSGWLHAGSHTHGYNSKSIGISFIGNFESNEPTSEALDAAKALIKCGVEKGHLTSNYYVVGHRQLSATRNPGRKLYNEIKRWSDWLDDVSSIMN